ncbi:MAG: DUF1214 domain-containing protein [Gammaproteobacteria bacterium]|nr:DUF1214 domain-containing protein [Gammaproteobacteria bacterium]
MSDDIFDDSSWNEFCDNLKNVGQQILRNAPDSELDTAEGFRYLARITSHALGRFVERPNPLRPQISYISPRIGGDNPDFLYGSCTISGEHDYVLRGNREQAYNVGIGSYYGGLGSGKGLLCSGYLLLNDLEMDAMGNFEIQVSREEKPGNWLPILAESNSILIRQTLLNRAVDAPANIAIQCLAGEQARTCPEPLRAEVFEKSLQLAGIFIGGVVGQFLNWTNTFKANTNQIHPLDPSLLAFAEGDPNTRYNNGYFELAEGEVLVVELSPPQCEYWNLQVTNHWLESLDYMDYRTHYNHDNARVDDDGKVRLYIAKDDPGLPNWIDTAGHDRGGIALRWIKAEGEAGVTTRVLTQEALRAEGAS